MLPDFQSVYAFTPASNASSSVAKPPFHAARILRDVEAVGVRVSALAYAYLGHK